MRRGLHDPWILNRLGMVYDVQQRKESILFLQEAQRI
jgi:hypothetical protein